MKPVLAAIVGIALSAPVFAQDILEQLRDNATRGMNEFRMAHKAAIEAKGWRFVVGTQSVEEVPVSDVFIKGVKTEQGPIRSAYLLNVFYVAVPSSETREYLSSKMLVWFDCKSGSYEQHILERYATVDGSGNPVSRTAEKQEAGEIEIPGADVHSYEKALLGAICTIRL
jgi:hypothetical protein